MATAGSNYAVSFVSHKLPPRVDQETTLYNLMSEADGVYFAISCCVKIRTNTVSALHVVHFLQQLVLAAVFYKDLQPVKVMTAHTVL